MKKISLPLSRKIFLSIALSAVAAIVVLPGCFTPRDERRREVLAKMEIVEVDHRGYVRYQGDVIKPGMFANRFRARREAIAGKPVLLSVNPEVETNQPAVVPYLRRVIEDAGAGKIYTKVPVSLDE